MLNPCNLALTQNPAQRHPGLELTLEKVEQWTPFRIALQHRPAMLVAAQHHRIQARHREPAGLFSLRVAGVTSSLQQGTDLFLKERLSRFTAGQAGSQDGL